MTTGVSTTEADSTVVVVFSTSGAKGRTSTTDNGASVMTGVLVLVVLSASGVASTDGVVV